MTKRFLDNTTTNFLYYDSLWKNGLQGLLLWVAATAAMVTMGVAYSISILLNTMSAILRAALPFPTTTKNRKQQIYNSSNDSKAKNGVNSTTTGKNRLIVVTGSDSGLGRALVELLATTITTGTTSADDSTNMHVLALTYTDQACQDLNERYHHADDPSSSSNTKYKSRFFAKRCDVTKPSDIESVRQVADQVVGNDKNLVLYGIVNNAAICDPGDVLWDQYLSTAQRTMEVNYFGVLRLTHAPLPILVSQNKGGKIINVTSVNGVVPTAGNSAYAASKFAVEGWSDALRQELDVFGISVSCVRPGSFKTNMHNMIQDRVVQNFRAASKSVRDLYGGEAYLKKWETLCQRATAAGQSPQIAAHLLYDILLETNSRAAYWAGMDAAILFRALQLLPTTVSDFVLRNLIDLKPLNADRQ